MERDRPADLRVGKALQFMQLVLELSHALQSLSKRMEASIGVTAAQRLAIRLIGRSPGCSPSDLADAMRIHRSTLTGILRRLEDAGAIAREPDAHDGRRAHLMLLARGREVDAAQRPTVEAAVRRALGRASARELDAARRVLELLAAEIEREAAGLDSER